MIRLVSTARRYTGLIPKISPLAVGTIAWTQLKLDRMAKQLPIDAPWTAKRAAESDARSVADYIEHTGIRTQIARDLFEMAVRGLFTGDLNDVSFLHLLFLVRGHGSINTLFSIENGSQENMVEGGAGSIARRPTSWATDPPERPGGRSRSTTITLSSAPTLSRSACAARATSTSRC